MEVETPVRTPGKSIGRTDPVDAQLVDQARHEIRGLVHEIAQLSKGDLAPREFYREFLPRVSTALAAVGAVVWTPAESGLKAEYQTGLAESDIGADADARRQHARLLERVLSAAEPLLVPPNSGAADERDNPTEHLLLLAPLKSDKQVHGIVEVFQRPGAGPATSRGYLRFLVQMCDLAGNFLQSRQLKVFSDRQELWRQWDGYARAVHATLDPRMTAATVANEGRRLVGCDRVTVALRRGRLAHVEAISGQEVFDRRAAVVRQLERLAAAVAATGETLWYAGDTRDLAPQVEEALQACVEQSHAKVVAAIPLLPPQTDDKQPKPRPLGVLIVEQFEQSVPRETLLERAEMVAGHAGGALANSLAHGRVFLMPVWKALGKATWLVQAQTLPKTVAAAVAMVATVAALVIVPADFDLEGRGTLEPVVRREVFAEIDGDITSVHARHGNGVKKGQILVEMRNTDLEVQLASLRGQRSTTLERQSAVELALLGENRLTPYERDRLHGERLQWKQALASIDEQLKLVEEKQRQLAVKCPIDGEVVTWNVVDLLIHRPVKRGDALMSVVDPSGPWQLEVLMPEDRMGHIGRARHELGEELTVSFILATDPGKTLTGQVQEVHQNAEVRGDSGNTVLVKVAIDKRQLAEPRPGAQVTAKVHCGRRSLGYVWFHDLAAFVQSRILFRL